MKTEVTPDNAARATPVAWVERTEGGLTRMWSGDLSAWAGRPANPEPLYSAATVAELRAEVERLSGLLEEGGRRLIDENMRASAAERRVGELEAALQAYQSAEAMSNYGDYSDFVFPKRSMRKEGEPAWGWICEKHGLGYLGGCVCCADDFKDHQNRKDREASYARNEALSAARQLAATALTGADPT